MPAKRIDDDLACFLCYSSICILCFLLKRQGDETIESLHMLHGAQ